MDYFRRLYETTAWLLMLQVQMREYPYSTVVSRYIYESGWKLSDSRERAIESVAVLLSFDRSGEPMTANIINELERNIAELAVDEFPESIQADVKADLKTSERVIDWYRNTDGKLK